MPKMANEWPRLRRSVHFVPGGSEKMLAKASSLAADSLVLDLEDAVAPDRKEAARAMVGEWLAAHPVGERERIVRINPLDTPWGRADLEATMAQPPDAYMIPKVRTLADVEAVDREIARLAAHYGLGDEVRLVLIATETPDGGLNLPTLTACRRVAAMTWGAEDLAAALGARRNRDDAGELMELFRYCRTRTLLCAAAAGVTPIDTVYVEIGNADGLRRECREAADMGFQGKLTIHPDQIAIVNDAFTPSLDEAEAALALLEAFDAAHARGLGAFSYQGQMVDVPHLERARIVVERARRAGVIG
jgi:citrate lyase subunit beta / citryl-CoA lyase